MTTLYGIKNCDSIRKARRWLKQHDIEYCFHDLREDGITRARLNAWSKTLGWERLLNRRGTTWRKLPAAVRDNIERASALEVMLEQPAIIKRPVLEHERRLYLGFSEASYAEIFNTDAQS